ncbi:hypothetical protein WR25_08937 isoform B [Diploscapter pachys]|uniref:Major facilitator superfamily (MFS) profile domain-containing protein n=1 Tax=Diploscapter pachys TaxID=2018661 RepID=A0A2A2LS61_9BILA|nr:hypothetical protein WR25_08937 isoform B [Diploscapter pachys]
MPIRNTLLKRFLMNCVISERSSSFVIRIWTIEMFSESRRINETTMKVNLSIPLELINATYADKTFTVDDAVEHLGFGRFQLKLSLLTGCAWMADAMELMLLSVLSPALACEWNISAVQQASIMMVVFSGMMLSSTFWGKICDRFGRKTGLMFSTLMACSMGVISSLSTNFYTFLLFRGLTGFGIGGVSQSITLYSEFLPSAHRAKCVSLIESFWSIGVVFEAVLAYFIMTPFNWRLLVLLSSLPLGIFSLMSFWLPESARYYIASGKSDKALAILQKAARENRCQLPSGTLVASHSNTAETRGDFSGLLTSEYRTTSLLLWIIWSVNAFCYYGNVQFATVLVQSHDECHGGNANDTQTTQCKPLTKDDYELLVYTTIAEFPGLILTLFIIEYLGRKKTMALEFGIFMSFTLLLFLCLGRTMVTVFVFIARAFISGAFQCAYVYTPEVYPTTLRAVGLGTASAMGRIGAISSPLVVQVLSSYWLALPIGIYSVAAFLGVFAAISLPIETKGRKMVVSKN